MCHHSCKRTHLSGGDTSHPFPQRMQHPLLSPKFPIHRLDLTGARQRWGCISMCAYKDKKTNHQTVLWCFFFQPVKNRQGGKHFLAAGEWNPCSLYERMNYVQSNIVISSLYYRRSCCLSRFDTTIQRPVRYSWKMSPSGVTAVTSRLGR